MVVYGFSENFAVSRHREAVAPRDRLGIGRPYEFRRDRRGPGESGRTPDRIREYGVKAFGQRARQRDSGLPESRTGSRTVRIDHYDGNVGSRERFAGRGEQEHFLEGIDRPEGRRSSQQLRRLQDGVERQLRHVQVIQYPLPGRRIRKMPDGALRIGNLQEFPVIEPFRHVPGGRLGVRKQSVQRVGHGLGDGRNEFPDIGTSPYRLDGDEQGDVRKFGFVNRLSGSDFPNDRNGAVFNLREKVFGTVVPRSVFHPLGVEIPFGRDVLRRLFAHGVQRLVVHGNLGITRLLRRFFRKAVQVRTRYDVVEPFHLAVTCLSGKYFRRHPSDNTETSLA